MRRGGREFFVARDPLAARIPPQSPVTSRYRRTGRRRLMPLLRMLKTMWDSEDGVCDFLFTFSGCRVCSYFYHSKEFNECMYQD